MLPSAADATHYSVVGRLDSPQAAIVLRYHAARAKDVQRTFAIDAAGATGGSLLRRIWAQRKLNELLEDETRNQQEIAALGKQFGIVTPCTSLMVLETLQQYLIYGIEPPDSSLQMKRDYLRLTGEAGHPLGGNGGARLTVAAGSGTAPHATSVARAKFGEDR